MAFRHILSRYRAPFATAAIVAAAAAATRVSPDDAAPTLPRLHLIARAEAPRSPRPSPAPAPAKSAPPGKAAPRLPPVAPLSRYAVADAVEHVLPAVVNIRRISAAVTPRHPAALFGALGSPAVEVSCGSGFFVSSDGLILTNAHVVQPAGPSEMLPLDQHQHPHHVHPHQRQQGPDFHSDAAGNDDGARQDEDAYLQVTLSSGETYVARVVAVDRASDIALVRINADRTLPVAELGSSSSVRPGEFVAAVGSPLALANSVSFGIVSTLARDLSPPAAGLNHLQLDVAINEGSSGGPVVSLDGRVVGICSMKIAGGAEGIAFAIPIDYARRAVDDLLKHGFVRRPFVGVTLISVTPELFEDIRQDAGYRPPRWLEAEIRRTNCAKSVGLMVHDLAPGAPAEKAGLKPGDVIVAVNGVETTTTSEFLAMLAAHVETECVLRVRRAALGETVDVKIRPQVLPANHQRQ